MGKISRRKCRAKPTHAMGKTSRRHGAKPPTREQPTHACCFKGCKFVGRWRDCSIHLKSVHNVTDMRGLQQLCTIKKDDMKFSLPRQYVDDTLFNASSKIHCLSCIHVYSNDEAVEFFERCLLPSLGPITTKESIHELLQFEVKYYHPVVRKIVLDGRRSCICDRWACHPNSMFCENHTDYSKLKELYPYPRLLGTLEDQEQTKFHFWLSTKGGTRPPVHLEYNPHHLEDFFHFERPK